MSKNFLSELKKIVSISNFLSRAVKVINCNTGEKRSRGKREREKINKKSK